jgi:hypothetical protein
MWIEEYWLRLWCREELVVDVPVEKKRVILQISQNGYSNLVSLICVFKSLDYNTKIYPSIVNIISRNFAHNLYPSIANIISRNFAHVTNLITCDNATCMKNHSSGTITKEVGLYLRQF